MRGKKLKKNLPTFLNWGTFYKIFDQFSNCQSHKKTRKAWETVIAKQSKEIWWLNKMWYSILDGILEYTKNIKLKKKKECKCRKSRDTWSNRQVWPWSAKWSREKARRILPRQCTGHRKHLFQQHKIWLYTWTSPDDQHQNQTHDILCRQRWRSSIQSVKTGPGINCGSDHELLAKFRLKLKKVWKLLDHSGIN